MIPRVRQPEAVPSEGALLRLALVLGGHALQRIAAGASTVLVGLYLAGLAARGAAVGAGLVGILAAVSFAAELVGAVPFGVLADAVASRKLMAAGSLLGAIAAQLFGMSALLSLFFLSRVLEGLATAAVTPPLLAHLTDVTSRDASLRAKAMSYFELSLLAGLALGGLLGSQLWGSLGTSAFAATALVYVCSASLLYLGAPVSRGFGMSAAASGWTRALRVPEFRHLAPVWLCMNAIVGLWLGPTLSFLMTRVPRTGQLLDGVFALHPDRVGWVLLAYAAIFAAGVTAWSFLLPRLSLPRVLRITLAAMLAVCVELLLFNHARSETARWAIGGITGVSIMIESGFSPAALALLSGALGAQSGRGAAMGIYSVLLGVGAMIGSLVAAEMGSKYAVDGLIFGTLGLAVLALALAARLDSSAARTLKTEAHEERTL